MGFIGDDNSTNAPKKPTWEYKTGVVFQTVLPDTSRDVAFIMNDLDPTKTWVNAIPIWVHQWKGVGGFITAFCDKWNEACPMCFENEIYKQGNPNYKNTGGRLPYGLSKKGLIQIWDFQERKVLWLLAGQDISQGMDFILTRQTNLYKGFVTLTRMGSGTTTKYRVDINPGLVLDDFAKAEITRCTIPVDQVANILKLNRQEFMTKTMINPVLYFQQRLSQFPTIDISNWGPVPTDFSNPPVQTMPTNQPVNQPSPTPAQNVSQPMPGMIKNQINLPDDLNSALNILCTIGVFQNKKLVDVIDQTGKPYIHFLTKNGSQPEKDAAQIILNNWELVEKYMKDYVPF